ncbi:MAG: hypothetical protein WBM32_03905 [Crocosphaera sp.]|jgi:hypothetical protein
MLIPLLSLLVGMAIFSVSSLVYAGVPIIKSVPWIFKLKNHHEILLGLALISMALMLGIVGYFGYIDGSLLRMIRVFLGIGGLLVMSFPVLHKYRKTHNFIARIYSLLTLKTGLTIASLILLFSIFLISFFDGNYGGDAYMYHLPFAARIWGITSPEQYIMEDNIEQRLKGFPLLANFLQGFFWKVFQRPEATNLLAFCSLITIISYLKFYLKIPFYLATISLLAVPMVHMHAARSYIDLPGNVCVAILILTTYLLYINKIPFNNKTFLVIIASAAGAANIKFQLIPVVFIALLAVLPQVILKYGKKNEDKKLNLNRIIKSLSLCFIASLIIFATPIKNIAIYQNPFYPVKVEIAGVVLNYNEAAPNFMHESLRKLPRHLRWGKSVLEIDAFDDRRPWPWTLAMDFISWDEAKFGLGGYFGGYVVFNLFLFIYLCVRRFNNQSKIAIILMLIMTAFTPIMPQAYELRYYMYWMIIFVALNCYLVCHNLDRLPDKKVVNAQYFALVAAGFMFIFMEKTNYFFTKPSFSPFSDYVDANVSEELFEQIQDSDSVCLIGKVPHSFLYNSYFHPSRNYSIKAEFDISPEYVADKCGGRKILK